MSTTNDKIAFVLSNTYNFSPPRKINPAYKRITDPGKYEPDSDDQSAEPVILLAHWADKSNVLIKIDLTEFPL